MNIYMILLYVICVHSVYIIKNIRNKLGLQIL